MRRRFLGLLITVASVSSGCAYDGGMQGQFASVRNALRPIGATMNSKLYVVQTGDNLSYIAWRYQTTVQSLVVWNNLSDQNSLQVGQPIVVRGGRPVTTIAAVKPAQSLQKSAVQVSAAEQQKGLVAVPVLANDEGAQRANVQSVVIPPSSERTVVVMQAPISQERLSKPRVSAGFEEKVVVKQVSYKKPGDDKWVWPVDGIIIKPFGGPSSNQKGVDISSTPGQSVRATTGGIVAFAGMGVPVLGNTIIIDHEGDMVSAYTKVGELLVEEGEEIMAGDVIAYTAGVNGQKKSKIHFEIRKQGRALDPLSKLAKR